MAFPTIPTAGANTLLTAVDGSATTTHTFPSLTTLDNAAGDLLIAIIVQYNASSTTNAEFSSWGAGFTEFGDSATSTTAIAMGCAYKFSDGTETGTFTVTSAGSFRSAQVLLSVKGPHSSTVPEVAFSAATTTTAQDPPNLDPSWSAAAEDILWIAVAGGGQTSLTGTWGGITSAPANYGNYAESAIAGGDVIGACQIAVAFRQLNASAENPGSFTTDTSPEIERAATIAVRSPVINLQTLSATQVQTPSTSRTLAAVRTLTVTQTQVPTLARLLAALRTLAATQTQVPTLATATAYLRTLTATQTQVPSLDALFVPGGTDTPQSIDATQVQVPTLTRLLALGRTLAATQAQAPSLAARVAYLRTLAATQAQTPTLDALFVPAGIDTPQSLGATQVQVPSLVAVLVAATEPEAEISATVGGAHRGPTMFEKSRAQRLREDEELLVML